MLMWAVASNFYFYKITLFSNKSNYFLIFSHYLISLFVFISVGVGGRMITHFREKQNKQKLEILHESRVRNIFVCFNEFFSCFFFLSARNNIIQRFKYVKKEKRKRKKNRKKWKEKKCDWFYVMSFTSYCLPSLHFFV